MRGPWEHWGQHKKTCRINILKHMKNKLRTVGEHIMNIIRNQGGTKGEQNQNNLLVLPVAHSQGEPMLVPSPFLVRPFSGHIKPKKC